MRSCLSFFILFLSAVSLALPVSAAHAASSRVLAPVIQYGAGPGFTGGEHTLLSGETLDQIAKRYRVDLGALMRLNDGVSLVPGARLKLPLPGSYKVKAGDTVYQLSRMFNIAPAEIIRYNNLSGKEGLKLGQVLYIPGSAQTMTLAKAIPVSVSPKTVVTAHNGTAVAEQPVVPRYPVGTLGTLTRKAPGSDRTAMVGGSLPKTEKAKQNPLLKQASYTSGQVQSNVFRPAAVTPIAKIKNTGPIPPRAGNRFLRPADGRILSSYGVKGDGRVNEGINIAASRGAPVRAAENGRIVYIGNAAKGYGTLILVKHADGYMTAYAHLDRPLVAEGQDVRRGETIGTVGSSGNVDRPQLHFEIRKGRESVNPVAML
jgi:murein DD-endopeptidase MepM/ murein hydrolase activator NlpD